MKTCRRPFFLALLLSVQAAAFAQEEHPAPLKVLFIGNSYTAANNLPAMLEGLADASGGRKIHTDRHLVGGCTLERHVEEKKAVDKIHSGKWDVVVLQEQSLRPVLDRQSMHKYARLLDAEIKQQGAKTVFYLTSTVTLSANRDLRERVERSIRVDYLQEQNGEVSLPFHLSSQPLGSACEVYVRQGATSWKLGTVTSPVRPGFGYSYISAKLPDLDVNQPADVVFRPAARLAETTPHLYKIWGKEVVKSNIRFRVFD